MFRCRRVDDTLNAVEHVEMAISVSGCVVSINGTDIITFTADDIDSVITFDKNDGAIGVGSPIVFLLTKGIDFVLLVDGNSSEVLTMIRDMKQRRVGKTPKLVVYQMNDFDEFVVSCISEGTVRWRETQARNILAFPHSRVDFLKFHLNRSVMAKLSSFQDRRIEMTADSVSCSGSFSFQDVASGTGDQEEFNKLAHAVESAMSHNDLETLTNITMNHHPLAHDMVIILSDQAVYLTERTGAVRLRLELPKISAMALVNKRGAMNVAPCVYFLTDAGPLWLLSKFVLDLVNRIVDLPSCHHVRLVHPKAIPDALEKNPTQIVAAPTTVIDMVSTETQTDVAESPFVETPATSVIMRIRVEELEEEVRVKTLALQVLQRRSDDKSSRNKKNVDTKRKEDESALRFYASLLEVEIERLRNQQLEQRVRSLEGAFEGQDDDPRFVKYTNLELQRREHAAQEKVLTMRKELHHLGESIQYVTENLKATIQQAAESFVGELRDSALRFCADRPPPHWSGLVQTAADFEERIQQEVGVRTASMSATIASLNDELKKREHQVAMLAEELDRFFSDLGDSSSAAGCLSAIKKIVERSNAVTDLHHAMTTKAGVEAKIRALLRQFEDLKASREGFAREAETFLGFGTIVNSATELERLRRENSLLKQLQYVPSLVAELAELRSAAEDSARHKAETLEAKTAARLATERLRGAEQQLLQLRRETVSSKAAVSALERELQLVTKRYDDGVNEWSRTSERMRREVADLRKQLKLRTDTEPLRKRSLSRSVSQQRSTISPSRTPETRGPAPRDELVEAPRVPPLELPSPQPLALEVLRQEREKMQRLLSAQRVSIPADRECEADVVGIPTPSPQRFGVVSDASYDPIALTKQRFELMKQRLNSLGS